MLQAASHALNLESRTCTTEVDCSFGFVFSLFLWGFSDWITGAEARPAPQGAPNGSSGGIWFCWISSSSEPDFFLRAWESRAAVMFWKWDCLKPQFFRGCHVFILIASLSWEPSIQATMKAASLGPSFCKLACFAAGVCLYLSFFICLIRSRPGRVSVHVTHRWRRSTDDWAPDCCRSSHDLSFVLDLALAEYSSFWAVWMFVVLFFTMQIL